MRAISQRLHAPGYAGDGAPQVRSGKQKAKAKAKRKAAKKARPETVNSPGARAPCARFGRHALAALSSSGMVRAPSRRHHVESDHERLADELAEIRRRRPLQEERVILGPQGSEIAVERGEVLDFAPTTTSGCRMEALVAAAKDGLDRFGFGMSSVRFICGTQSLQGA